MSDSTQSEKFRWKHVPSILKSSVGEFVKDDPWRLSAVVAFYAMLSMPGLVVVIINGIGAIWGHKMVSSRFTDRIDKFIGPEAADTVRNLVENTQSSELSLPATIVAVVILAFGSTGVFFHLQRSLNQIWGIETSDNAGIKQILLDRGLSFLFVLILGLLLLISFVLTTAASLMGDWIGGDIPYGLPNAAYLLNIVFSVGVVTVLFALIFRVLSDAKPRWNNVWIGALVSAVLFIIARLLLEVAFGKFSPKSLYGTAGSVVLILLWVWLSAQILFFGAEFIGVISERYGKGIRRDSDDS